MYADMGPHYKPSANPAEPAVVENIAYGHISYSS